MSARTVFEVRIDADVDLVTLRQRVRRLSELIEFETQDQTRIATAVSEIAREISRLEGRATLAFTIDEGSLAIGFVVALPPRATPIDPGEFGEGLVRARRLMDGFDDRVDGNSIHLSLSKRLPRDRANPSTQKLADIADAMRREAPGDRLSEVRAHNEELIRGLDEVKAKQDELEKLNHELEVTNRGVVALYAELDQKSTELQTFNRTLEQRIEQALAERERAHDQLRQSQKMEAVGQLTGGIAHDFNNLLQAISGNLEIVERNLPPDHPRLHRSVAQATRAAKSAAVLTQRLLAFSRQQALAPMRLDVNELVTSLLELLRRTIGENVSISTQLVPEPWFVEVDPNELENALINLCVNARDAMPEGGSVTIETQNLRCTVEDLVGSDQPPGPYVAIRVRDTGSGMTPETLARVFEPFFTTKEVGKGTGLGLAMVYGFAKQSGGLAQVTSTLGAGTTVSLLFPMTTHERSVDITEAPERAEPGSGTILVVEDDETVRAYSEEALCELGYTVLVASTGADALLIIAQNRTIDLLFTDVVLSGGMTGRQLATMAKAARPGLRVLYTSGYARNALEHNRRLDPDVDLLNKPYSFVQLATRISSALGKPT